jgi:hypothetical protein
VGTDCNALSRRADTTPWCSARSIIDCRSVFVSFAAFCSNPLLISSLLPLSHRRASHTGNETALKEQEGQDDTGSQVRRKLAKKRREPTANHQGIPDSLCFLQFFFRPSVLDAPQCPEGYRRANRKNNVPPSARYIRFGSQIRYSGCKSGLCFTLSVNTMIMK